MLHPIKHFKTITEHRNTVMRYCFRLGLYRQGLLHDLSKYGPTEFWRGAKFYQGDRSPNDAERRQTGITLAWLHHKGRNKHHWEWWTDFGKNGEIIANKIPSNYVVEMICDWIGAGMVYGGEDWTQAEPLNYYNKVRAGRHFHPETEELLIKLLEIIRDKGLEEFHRICKQRYPLLTDYDGLYIP